MSAWVVLGFVLSGCIWCETLSLAGDSESLSIEFRSRDAASNRTLRASFPVEITVRITESATPDDGGEP